MGRACSMYGGKDNCIEDRWKNMIRNHLDDYR